MKPVTKRLKKSIEQLHAAKRESIGTCADPLPSSACGCMNGLAIWRGPKGEKGDQGPKGDKGDNAGSFLTGAEFVVNPEGQEPGSYLKLELIDVAQQEIVVYVDLSELEDVYAAGQGIDITNNIVSVELDPASHVLTLGANGLGAGVYLSTGSSGTNLVLTGVDGTVLSTVPITGDGITLSRTSDGGLKFTTNPVRISADMGNIITEHADGLYASGLTGVSTDVHCDAIIESYYATEFSLEFFSDNYASQSSERTFSYSDLETDEYSGSAYWRDNGRYQYAHNALTSLATQSFTLIYRSGNITRTYYWTYEGFDYMRQGLSTAIMLPNGCVARVYVSNVPTSRVNGVLYIELYLPWQSAPRSVCEFYEGAYNYISLGDSAAGADVDISGTISDLSNISVYSYPIGGMTVDGVAGTVLTEAPFNITTGVLHDVDGVPTFTAAPVDSSSWPTHKVGDALTADLIVTGSDGVASRADLKPLLERVGGKIVEVPDNCTASVLSWGDDCPQPYFYDANGVRIYAEETVPWNGEFSSFTFTFAEEPDSVNFCFWLPDGGFATLTFEGSTYENGSNNVVALQRLIDAGASGTRMYNNGQGTGDATEPTDYYLVVTDNGNYSYTFSMNICTSVKPSLCLESSCDPCIDLSPALGVDLQGSFRCEGTPYLVGSRHAVQIYYYTEEGSFISEETFHPTDEHVSMHPPVNAFFADIIVYTSGGQFAVGPVPISELVVGAIKCLSYSEVN